MTFRTFKLPSAEELSWGAYSESHVLTLRAAYGYYIHHYISVSKDGAISFWMYDDDEVTGNPNAFSNGGWLMQNFRRPDDMDDDTFKEWLLALYRLAV